jgi:vacuolar-type H+-ATPase subunit C/Vma6
VLRGIFGPERKEVTGDCRKLHNEELHDLYSSQNINRVIHAVSIDKTCSMHKEDVKFTQKLSQKT